MALSTLHNMVSNAALLLVLGFLYTLIIRHWHDRTGQILNGILFGGVAIGVMLTPLNLLPGVVFDTRSVVISVGGLFGGPVVAAISFAMASVFRTMQGGDGALMGVLVCFFSAALGTGYHFWKERDPRAMRPAYLYGFGLVVHLVLLACTLALPGAMTWLVLSDIALPVLIVYPVATLLLCLLIADRESQVAADRLLKESEERYRRILDTAIEGIWLIDENLITTFVNASMAEMMRCRPDELVGRPLRDFVFPDDLPKYREQMRLRREGGPARYEIRLIRKDGSILWAQVSAAPIHHQGAFAGSLAMYSDITRRMEIEEAQKTDLVRRRMAMDLAQMVHWEYDVASDRFTFNDQFYALYGTTAQAQGGYQMSAREYAQRFIPPEEAPLVQREVALAIETDDPHFIRQLEHRIIRADGQERFLNVRFAIIKDEQGKTTKAYGVNQDITEQRLTMRSLREANERFQLAFETSPDSININRLSDGLYLEINQGFMDIMGYTREEVVGRTSLDLDIWVDPADRAELVRGLREKGVYANLEAQFRRKDGTVTTGLMSASVIRIQGEPHIISVTRDIGQMRQTERERAELQEKLQQAQKMEALGTLAGGIAHDFNNILSAITGYSELALDAAGQGDCSPEELRQIMLAADRAKELVRQILAFSRKGVFDPKPLNLNRQVSQAVAIMERTISKMISIEFHGQDDLWLINGDPNHLEQVLLNLASNAQDAMPHGGKLVIETANLSLGAVVNHPGDLPPGDYVLLTVSDTGEGMDRDTLEHIFEPFYTTKEVGKGTGLGLASVYGIVKSHGGYISCQSQPGLGTTFKVHLPALGADTLQETAEPGETQPELAGRETLLLVDDEEALREIGSRILQRMGYTVRTAGSGEDALALYRREGPAIDLVIMDLGMPGMGGHQALRAILAEDPEARIIIASGYAATNQVKAALEAGAAGYVAKPFRRVDLLGEIRRVLEGGE